MFIKILVLLIFITSVINQCLLPVKTGYWSLLIPIIFSNRKIVDEKEIILNNVYVWRGGCLMAPDDIEEAIYELKEKLRHTVTNVPPFLASYADYAFVMTNATFFENDYFHERQTGRLYAWDRSLELLSTYYKAEAEESVLNGSTTEFITFNLGNGVNFSLQLVERINDLWTTNEPFLFLSNSSRFCNQDGRNIDLFKTFLEKAPPLFCDTVINGRSGNTSENITILVVILITITVAIIVCAYVLRKKCSRKQKQHIRESSLVYKKRTNENTESGYEDPVEVHEYAEVGNTNRIFYDLQGNRVNEILGKEQLEYDYAYSTFKPLK